MNMVSGDVQLAPLGDARIRSTVQATESEFGERQKVESSLGKWTTVDHGLG